MKPATDVRNVVIAADPALAARLDAWLDARAVFVVGLPGTGKSLLVHQAAHLASERDRIVHLVQWDVARPVFEATAAAARYPVRAGVTHALIRKAIGHWVRRAVASWDAAHPGGRHLLIGEAPFVGNRFVELARRADDRAEPLLASPACRFVIPVPSRSVRAFLEAERERRAAEPLHERERHDAPPSVLRDLWRELLHVAVALGLASAPADDASPAWDPDVYRAVYEALLRHRHADVVPVETVLSTRSFSVYDFAVPPIDVVPGADEATTCIRDVEARYPDPDALERDVARWYVV